MKTLNRIAILALLAVGAFGQTIVTQTTLGAAITSSSARQIVVASATGVTAGTTNLYVDRELMVVNAVSGTTLTVQRGAGGTAAGTHASGALVFLGPAPAFNSNPRVSAPTNGSCTRSNEPYLPLIDVTTATIADCLGGQWLKGQLSGTTLSDKWKVSAPDPGGTLYTGINTNGTAVGATTLYCTEVWLPVNKNLTGIGVLNGTTVTGNARYVILYDSAGNALANSALAGQASVTASVYETYAFTSKYFAIGPARYFGCIQDNATGSTTVRMAVTGQGDTVLTKGQTGATFGTVPALTVPTTFTTAVGPFIYLY